MAALIPAIIELLIGRMRGGGGGGGGGGKGGAPRMPADPEDKHQKIWQSKLMGLIDDDLGGRGMKSGGGDDDPWGDMPNHESFNRLRGL